MMVLQMGEEERRPAPLDHVNYEAFPSLTHNSQHAKPHLTWARSIHVPELGQWLAWLSRATC